MIESAVFLNSLLAALNSRAGSSEMRNTEVVIEYDLGSRMLDPPSDADLGSDRHKPVRKLVRGTL
ncbi:hypothetical protein HYDPIDRAFT_111657 [Hydnomerulius pinastri MD-312]|uniref:Uncharacterized protein n=1 Tax=Hydnomerulius pinastri MD-312 TaxID=994086 RepID=A0A0C9WG79_9AGAM|nr:hypothetical protein HYDPIDRAFT_111657 [Hydnomerulius pinastri MD-312]